MPVDEDDDAVCADCGDDLPPGHDPADLCPICTIVAEALREQAYNIEERPPGAQRQEMRSPAMQIVAVFQLQQTGTEFARLNPDGTAVVNWPEVRRIASEVIAQISAKPPQTPELTDAVAALLWAVAQPGVKP